MAQKKSNFRRTTITRAKAAVKKHRAAKKRKSVRIGKDNPKQMELGGKLDAIPADRA